MLKYLLAPLFATVLHAAVIRGVVVENFTSKPLARAAVVLEPVAGTPGAIKSIRANSLGVFEFDSLAAGAYVIKASRKGFMPLEYGQKRWNSAGRPLTIEEGASAFLTLRLIRYSAITGVIVDENDVGLPGFEIAAYRKTEPPEWIAQAVTDDRGVYRIHGLEPGSYVVRTAGTQYEDGMHQPTFSKETVNVLEARTIELLPEQDADKVDVRPLPGRLFRIAVGVDAPPTEPVTITLASAMGRKTVKAFAFEFADLPPGDYEGYAQQGESQGAMQRVALARDTQILLTLPQSPIQVVVSGAPAADPGELRVRRKDLAGVGAVRSMPLVDGRAALPRGRWEVMLIPPAGFYVSSASASGPRTLNRTDGWNEINPGGSAFARFSVSGGASSVHGTVKTSTEPVSGAPGIFGTL